MGIILRFAADSMWRRTLLTGHWARVPLYWVGSVRVSEASSARVGQNSYSLFWHCQLVLRTDRRLFFDRRSAESPRLRATSVRGKSLLFPGHNECCISSCNFPDRLLADSNS